MSEKEKDLVEMVLEGNLDAFEPLVSPYRRILLSFAYRMSGNLEDAKEISQETLMRAFKYLKRYDPKRSFKNWLFQILVNVARRFSQKKERIQNFYSLSQTAEQLSPQQNYIQKQLKTQLLECLDILSSREREVFLLRDIENCGDEESAKILGCSSISVRVHLSAARKKIKERIKEKFPYLWEEKR